MASIDDALDKVLGPQASAPAPAAAPGRQLTDMDGTDLGEDTSAGPALREPSQGELESQGLDQPYSYTRKGKTRTSPGVVLPDEAPAAMPLPEQPAAPAEPMDPIDAALAKVLPGPGAQAQSAQQAGAVLAFKAQQTGLDPERARAVVSLAKQTGQSTEFVAQNFDAVKKQADDKTQEFQQTATDAPLLTKHLASNGVLPASAADDLPHLSLLQRALTDPWHTFMDANASIGEGVLDTGRAVFEAPRALADAMYDQAKVALQMQDFLGLGDQANDTTIKNIEANHPDTDYGVHGFVGKAIIGAAKAIPYIALDAAAKAIGSGVGEGVGRLAGAALALGEEAGGGGPENPVADVGAGATVAAAGAAGKAGGGFVGSALFNGSEITGPVWYAVKDKLDADGNPINPTVARILAGTAGLVGGVGMAAGGGLTGKLLGGYVEPLLRKIPGGEALLGRFGAEAVAREIASSGVAANMDRVLVRYGVHQLQGMVTMAEQSMVTSTAEQTANLANGGDFSVKAVLSQGLDAFVKSFNDFALISAHGVAEEHGPALAMLEAKGKEASSAQNANRLAAIVAAVTGSKTAEQSPSAVADLVKRAKAEPDAVQNVHIAKAAWDTLWQGEKTDPAAAARAVVGDDGKAYHQAKATGGDVVIPIERYAAFARSKYAEKLLGDSRLSQDDFSPNEAKARDEALRSRFKELSVIPPDKMGDEARAVYDDYKRKAQGSGRGEAEADANAKIVAASMTALSERFQRDGKDVSPFELYTGRSDVARRVTITGPGGRVAAEDAPEAPQRAEQRAAFNGLSEPDKRERFFTDRRTGLYNFRGYEARPDDMSRPYTTEVQLASGKTINDKLGHEYGDHALKIMGNITRAAGIPDAVRRGNTVSFDHATPEQGAEIAKKIQDAIGHGQVVTSGTAKADALMTPAERLEAAAKAHKEVKDAGRADKSIPERDAPFTSEAAGLKEHLAAAKRPETAKVLPEHEESYAQHVEEHDPFDTIHVGPEGLLTEDGWHHATDLAEKRAEALAHAKYGKDLPKEWRKEFIHYVSADARGIKAIDEKFGHKPTDEIMSHLSRALANAGGAKFDVAHPHGDEFYAVHVGKRSDVERFFRIAADESEHVAFWRLDGDNVDLQDGVKLAHGIGADFHEADSERLPEAKLKQGEAIKPQRLHRTEFDKLASARHADRRGHELVRVGEPTRGEDQGEGGGGRGSGGGPAGADERGEAGGAEGQAGGVEGRGDAAPGGGEVGSGPGRDGRQRQPGELDVAPGVVVDPSASVPTEAEMGKAKQIVARMRHETNRAEAEDFLQYIRDYLDGKDTSDYRFNISRDALRKLAAVGVVDPQHGFTTEDELRHAGRGGARHVPGAASMRDSMGRPLKGTADFDKFVRNRQNALDQQTKLQSRVASEPTPNLLVQHNLTEDNLKHADELGGLPAPSLAIARKEHPLTGFGEVTLLAHPSLADPKQGTPAFASDIYSPRHPRANYEVNGKALRSVTEKLKPFAAETGAYLSGIDGEIAKRGAAKAIEERSLRPALEAAFLHEKGIKVEPVMRDTKPERAISEMPSLKKFFKENGVRNDFAVGDDYHQKLSHAVSWAIRDYAEEAKDSDIGVDLRKEFLDDKGMLVLGRSISLLRDAERVGAQEVDRYATQDALAKKVKEVGEPEFKKWATDLLKPVEGAAHIRKTSFTSGGDQRVRRIPYTLENVLKEITKKLRQGEGFNYGLGWARSTGTKKFRSIADIQKARDSITSKAEFDKLKEANDERFGELSDELRKYHSDPGGFHVLDSLVEAISESYKRGHSLSKELELSQFKGVPQELQAKVADFARDLIAMPTEYFEAKPQRAVGIGEFRGAVVPHDASPETLATLKKHGIDDIETYKRGDDADRQAAIARLAGVTHVLFQPPEGGSFTLESSPKRGEIVFTPAGTGQPRTFKIKLFARADKSTLAHETFHFLSEVFGDVASRADAPEDVKRDYATMLKYMEYEGAPGNKTTGFRTELGSTYTIAGERTQRTKAAREGHADSGLKGASDRTLYLDPAHAREVGMWQGLSNEGKRIIVKGDEVLLTSINEKTGKRGVDGRFKFTTAPEVGRSPLELFEPDESGAFKGNHPGNKITEVTTGGGTTAHEQRIAQSEERRQLGEIAKPTKEQKARLRDLTAKEEKITHAWEQYLMEGKAPSAQLAGPFARFRTWLVGIYKTLSGIQDNFKAKFGQDLNLTDDIRDVFNRLLASDTEIEKQKAAADAQAIPELAAKMDPKDRAAYEAVAKKQAEDAKTEFNRRVAAGKSRENTKLADADREKIRAQVEKEMEQHPVYRALDYLQNGKVPAGAEALLDGKALRLDKQALVKKYGDEFVRELPRGIFAKAGEGVGADELAGLLGYEDGDGDAMIRALRKATPRGKFIDDEVQKRLLAKYPDLLDNPKAMGEEAINSLQNAAAVQRAIHERRALAKLIDPTRTGSRLDLDDGFLKEQAQRLVRQRAVGDLTAGDEGAAGYYRRAQQTAMRRMREAFEAGKLDKALEQNETYILNLHLWRAATDLRGELERGHDLLERSAKEPWRSALGKADQAADGVAAYRDAHDAILQAIGIEEPDPNRPPPNLDALVAAAGADAQELGFDVDGLRALLADPVDWKELTPDDAENVLDAVKNIRHAANAQNGLDLEGKRIASDKFFSDAEERLKNLPTAGRKKFIKEQAGFLAKKWDGVTGALKLGDAKLMGIEKLVNVLTNGDHESPLYKLAVEDEHACRAEKMRLGKEVLADLRPKFEDAPKELKSRLNDLVDLSDLPLPQELVDQNWMTSNGKMKLKDALTMACNMGNAANKQRLLEGYGWTEPQVMTALDREIGKAGWDWAQGVLDSLEKLYPHIERVHEQETGLKPGKVQATPIKSAHGTYRGGYFPLKADPRFKNRTAERQEAGPVAQMFGPNYTRASTAQGHTKDRAARAQYQVNLDYNSVQAHVAQVIHDVAYRRWVKDMARTQADPRFATILKKYMGEQYLMQFDPWLKTIANGQADAIPANQRGEARAVGAMRNLVATQGLALNLPLALTHATYPAAFVLTGEVRADRMAVAMAQTYSSWKANRQFVLDNSTVMRERAERHGGELRSALDEMGAQATKWQRIAEHVKYGMLEWAEKLTATASWKARFEQEMAGGATSKEAVREADSMINNLYISKAKQDLPALIRDKGAIGSLLMFYGYMNKMGGAQRQWVRDLHVRFADEDRGTGSKALDAAKFAGKVLGLTLTQGIASEAFGGKGPEDDESIPEWLFRRALVFQASMVPFLGQIVDGLVLGKKVSVRQSPGLALAQSAAEKVGQVAMEFREGDDNAVEDMLKQLGLGATFAAGVPTYPLRTTGAYVKQAVEGDAETGLAATPRGLIYGPPRGR